MLRHALNSSFGPLQGRAAPGLFRQSHCLAPALLDSTGSTPDPLRRSRHSFGYSTNPYRSLTTSIPRTSAARNLAAVHSIFGLPTHRLAACALSSSLSSFSGVRFASTLPNKKEKTFFQKLPKRTVKHVIKPAGALVKVGAVKTCEYSLILLKGLKDLIFHPSITIQWWEQIKAGVVHGWNWTKKGFKLFGANFSLSVLLLKKKLSGRPLTFREHKLLVRTTSDLVKLIPFSFFVLVPFAELLLPVALWLFPGMLPSTFAEKQTDRPQLQRKLKAKQELTHFFQELVGERTRQILEDSTSEPFKDRARALQEFQQKLILKAKEESLKAEGTEVEEVIDVNPFLSLKETLTYAKLFREEFKIDNMPTKAIMVLCRMLGLQPYGIRHNVILQLRHHLLRLQREDREILWEGVETLSHEELVEACKERAMRFYDVSDDQMRDQMRQWLELSSHKDIPPLLLLWTRSITMTHSQAAEAVEEVPAPLTPAIQTEQPVDPSELLPVVEETLTEEQKTDAEQREEKRKMKEEKMKAELEEADKRIEQLKNETEILRKQQEEQEAAREESNPEEVLSVKEDEILQDKATKLDEPIDDPVASRIERAKEAKEELTRKCEKLEKEMELLRDVSDLQNEQLGSIIKQLTGLIEEQKQRMEKKTGGDAAEIKDRLEALLNSVEAGVENISEVLDTAKCIRSSGEDDSFYPSDDDEPSKETSTKN